MNKPTLFVTAALAAAGAVAQTSIPPTNSLPQKSSISIQEMLQIGPSGIKLHSLAMITQGKIQGEVDESYLPGFAVCSEDEALPVRSITARLLGQYFVQGKESPNPQAVDLLIKLSKDEASDVRYNAVYHGLSQIQNKSDEIIDLLIDISATNREPTLYSRIIESLASDKEKVTAKLDAKLKDGNQIAIYEIYEDFTGKKPADAEKYLAMPSSRPRLFIFKGKGEDAEAFKAKLEKALAAEGLKEPDLKISGPGENYAVMLKTYLTKDYITVEKKFSDSGEFQITQDMWLTPEMEIQIEAMNKMRK